MKIVGTRSWSEDAEFAGPENDGPQKSG